MTLIATLTSPDFFDLILVYLFGSQADIGRRFLDGNEVSLDPLSDLDVAGYRNRMVHFYREVTPEELYGIVLNHLKDLDRFIKEIAAFLKAYEERKK